MTLVGRSSEESFRGALEPLGVAAPEAATIGDDVDINMSGEMPFDMRGFLECTAGFREEWLSFSQLRPNAIIDSLAELPALL